SPRWPSSRRRSSRRYGTGRIRRLSGGWRSIVRPCRRGEGGGARAWRAGRGGRDLAGGTWQAGTPALRNFWGRDGGWWVGFGRRGRLPYATFGEGMGGGGR